MNTKPAQRPGETYLAKQRRSIVLLDTEIVKLRALIERERTSLHNRADQEIIGLLVSGQSIDVARLPNHAEGEALTFRLETLIRVRGRAAAVLAQWPATPAPVAP